MNIRIVEKYILDIKALIQSDVDNGIISETYGHYLFDILIRLITDTKVWDVYNSMIKVTNDCNISPAFNTPSTLLQLALIL